MAELINLDNLTLSIPSASDASEAVFKQSYLSTDITEHHEVLTGIENDRYIPIVGRMGLVGKLDAGDCSSNAVDSQIVTSEKKWECKKVSGRIGICVDSQLPDLFKMWKKDRVAANTWENISNEFEAFVQDQVSKSVKESIIRLSEFAAKTHSPVGDGTGNQLLTAGVDKGYFNIIDGAWQQVFASVSAGTLTAKVDIDQNNADNETAQKALTENQALDTLILMYESIAPEAFNTDLRFEVTSALYYNLMRSYENKSAHVSLERLENGVSALKVRGIPVIPRHDATRILNTYFKQASGVVYRPHRAILYAKNNIPVGTSDNESFSLIKAFYENKDKKWYFDFAFKLDCKVLLDEEIAVAY